MSTDVSLPAARLGEAEGAPDDALDLRRRVLAGVERRAVLANAARAEVEAADELAHDQDVDAVGDRRAQVRVGVERGAQREQALLGPHVRAVELGVAHRAFQHGNGGETRVARLVGKRRAGCANRGGADQPLVEHDVGREQLEHEARLRGDLGPDAVARQQDDAAAATRQTLPRRTCAADGRAGARRSPPPPSRRSSCRTRGRRSDATDGSRPRDPTRS